MQLNPISWGKVFKGAPHLDPGRVVSEGSVLDCPPRGLGMSSVEGTPSALMPP